MRINAYVLAADPAWVEESIASYYDLVDTIVVSYDRSGTSWTGTPIAVDESLSRLKAVDPLGKMVLSPGDYYRPDHSPLDNDTHQRSVALAEASSGADWVVQLDTDEVVLDLPTFRDCLEETERRGLAGLEFPARNLYQYAGGDRYLERCRRLWRVAGHYPGPVAVRAGSALTLCRQGPSRLFRVDFRASNTDPSHPKNAPVHRVVRPDEGILHFSWVRSPEHMRTKFSSWGHSRERDWAAPLAEWERSRTHPFRAVLGGEWEARATGHSLRLTTAPLPPDREALRRNGIPPAP